MKRLSLLSLVFAILFLVFVIALVFLRQPFNFYPLMSLQDVIDVLTPIVLIPIYFLLFRFESRTPHGNSGLIVFLVFTAFWVLGQGMHLSANSINNLLAQKQMETGDIYKLTYFYDEYLSHYLWHIGIVGLSAVLMYRQWKNPFSGEKPMHWPIVIGGLIHGFCYFIIIMEGNTAPLGITFSVFAVLFVVIFDRKKINQQPIIEFFLTSYILAVILFIIWGIWLGGLPPIMDVIRI